jgi:hypothetical protein
MADYATLLRDHITLTCRSIDRIFLQAYVPKLQSVGQVCRFLHRQRGFPIPSSAAFGQIGEAYVAEIHRWAKANGIPVRYFAKNDDKEKIAEPLLRAAAEEGGDGKVVLIGIAQEKASTWRSWKRKGQEHASHPHMEWGRQMAFINHFYIYLWDPEWGPAFWKTNAYAPYPIWLWLNGHSWAKRQLDKGGIAYQELDNGFRWCANPAALQRICNRLGPNAVHTFFWRWFHRLPSPFTTEDVQAGYAYDLAFRQFEVSDTRVFDQPQAGRAFFEGVIRDHLDIGPPRPGGAHLRSQGDATHSRAVSDQDRHAWCESTAVLHLQIVPAEAVLQARHRAPHRARHRRHLRLRDRAPGLRHELVSPTGRWRLSQPASM